ncbi:MAG: tRNA lysidine(34) synthetase TilS [Capnocytophaga sp.]|nr:tRNA lysidine(34) synthetase TilS [Capnocytophaga sp.]
MIESFRKHIATQFDLDGKAVLVAISGGLDSVVMSHLLWQAGIRIVLAHCNFSLRGSESDADEDFVKQWSKTLDCPLHCIRFDTKVYAQQRGLNTQLAARELRYEWFEQIRVRTDCQYIATAHHADDVWETFLINLSRGSGLRGLSSIPEHNKLIIRPLLHFSREEIRQYALDNQLQWRDDSSNTSDHYVRNRIRHHVSPLMKEIHPEFWQNFKQTMRFLNQTQQFVIQTTEQLKVGIFEYQDELISIDIPRFRSLQNQDFILHQWLYPYGFTRLADVRHLLDAETGKFIQSASHRLLKNRNKLIISKININEERFYTITEETCIIKTPIKMQLQIVEEIGFFSSDVIYIDADLLDFPLTIRHRQEGDYFYPFGMKGRKKVSKFFKDEKYSLYDKEAAWLLCNGNDIVWIIGKRHDNRYTASEKTRKILEIKNLNHTP